MSEAKKPTVKQAQAVLEEHHGLPEGSLERLGLGDFLKWLPVIQAIQATVNAIHDQKVGERVSIPQVKGIKVRGWTEDLDGAGLTRRS